LYDMRDKKKKINPKRLELPPLTAGKLGLSELHGRCECGIRVHPSKKENDLHKNLATRRRLGRRGDSSALRSASVVCVVCCEGYTQKNQKKMNPRSSGETPDARGRRRAAAWPLHDIGITNIVWCIAYKREFGLTLNPKGESYTAQ